MSDFSVYIIPVTPFQQNCTLLFDNESKRGVLVDPGVIGLRYNKQFKKKGLLLKLFG
ncbi:hypothetical protein Bho114_001060 [Bartonella sp. 114]|nr:hypothetical protein Bho114_001060 [Bartonella sp. 114]